MILAVTGGRAERTNGLQALVLCDYLRRSQLLVHGACPHPNEIDHFAFGLDSVDMWADEHAERLGVPRLPFPADWSRGPKAGPERNAAMAKWCSTSNASVLLLAFPGGRGTESCKRAFARFAIPIVEVPA